jgi:hypothetical protein
MSLETDGHSVKVVAEQIAGSDRWSAKVLITWREAVDIYKTEEFDGPDEGFGSKSEAESWGHELSYQNLDLGKAPKR